MGIFSKKETCCICNINSGNTKLADGYICKNCIVKCRTFLVPLSWKGVSSEHVHNVISATEKNNSLLNIFTPTKKVEKYLEIDEHNQLWKAGYLNVIFNYSDIINFELLENGEAITKGGVGSAIVGGALFGGVGAVVGGTIGKKKTKQEITEYRIKVVTKNIYYPDVYINFLTTGKVKSNGILYETYSRSAQRILSLFSIMTDAVSNNNISSTSSADEIMKYKKLLDDGIITQEEFESKKKQLLDL